MKLLSAIVFALLVSGCYEPGKDYVSETDNNISVASNKVGGLVVYEADYYGVTFLCFATDYSHDSGIDCFHIEEPK